MCVDARKNSDGMSNDNKDTEESKEIWYVFEVEDNGCGVTLADMKVMFNAYKQGNL